jgi:hypothetical protein
MVKLNPPILDIEGTTSDGEQLLFKRLEETKGGSNWFAIHSLDIFPQYVANQTEADFVVLAPGLGILVVEVKAHRQVQSKSGVWILSGKQAKRSPVKQANNAAFHLLNYLKDRDVDIQGVPVTFVVWFTHVPKNKIPSSSERNPAGFLGAEDLNRDIVEVLTEVMQKNAHAINKKLSIERIPGAIIDRCLKVLRPDFEVVMSPKDRELEVQKWLSSAMDQQVEMFKMLEHAPSVLIQGIAGTGKTHIALHEAKLAQLRGESTLFLCFNKLLAKYLEQELVDYPLIHVSSIHSFLKDVAEVDVPVSVEENWWKETLPSLVKFKLDESEYLGSFDTLIVDEAQDICLPQYLEILDLVLDDGLKGAKTRFFGDFHNQGIYLNGAESLNNLKAAVPGLFSTPDLDINCRNSEDLGSSIMAFLDEPNSYKSYRRKDKSLGMSPIVVPQGKDVKSFVKTELARLLKIFSPEQIVLLSSSRQKIDELAASLDEKMTPVSRGKPGFVGYGTVQEFKGLESLAVVLVEFEGTFTPSWQNFYIGATRTTSTFSFVLPEEVLTNILEKK